MNDAKPLWLRNPKEIDEDEYRNFYRLFSKTSADPLAKIHFTAEGEVTFKAILFVPAVSGRVCVWSGWLRYQYTEFTISIHNYVLIMLLLGAF